ncbi:MAG: hypothetical protein HY721_09190 [Planctomycetes bacterium]|nr:hypothetical protein [Planctomycetota bacterium]
MDGASRADLLEGVKALAKREAENVPSLSTFLPRPVHGLALRQETVVVRGGRGAGKSALFRLIRETKPDQLQRLIDDERIPAKPVWLDAFSQSREHPEVGVLAAFTGSDVPDPTLRTFWMAHLLFRLARDPQTCAAAQLPSALHALAKRPRNDVREWVSAAQERLGEVTTALDETEHRLAQQERQVFASYDHLDRIDPIQGAARKRYVAALLNLWLSLSNRYRCLRAKIFLREDLFEAAESAFPDATKLRPRSVSLEWDVPALYQVVVRHMAGTEALRRWLAEEAEIQLSDRGDIGWMPKCMDEDAQRRFGTRLAGETMGKGVKKGYTYRWIPNRLQDANVRIVPRSMLCLLGFSAEHAMRQATKPRGKRLLTPQDLHAGLENTSKERVSEVAEEYPLVRRLANFKGMQVLLDRDGVIECLSDPVEGDGAPGVRDGPEVLAELLRLGVLKVRPDGRIDVPDIYRYGFGIKRKGGVVRPK